MVYKFWDCTNPNHKHISWRDAFKINFSKTKIVDTLRGLLCNDDGSMKISQKDFDEINNVLNQRSIYNLNDIYKYIILMCLVVPSLNEENLSKTFTSCLKQTKIREGGDVTVNVKLRDKSYTFIIIHVNTFIPQRIEITLKRKELV